MTMQASPGQVEKVLEDLISRLTKAQTTAELRAALIEAKRLRNVTTRWAAIPPPPDARREMLTRVQELIAQVSTSLSKPPPPPDGRDSKTPTPPPPSADKKRESVERALSQRAFRATEPAMDSVRGRDIIAASLGRAVTPDESGPATLTPREMRERGLTPPPMPSMTARGLTPHPLSPRPRPMDSAPPTSSPPLSPPPSSGAQRSAPRSVPPPLRGRRPSEEPGFRSMSPPRAGFGSASRSKTKTGLSESEDDRTIRSNLPTAPPPPLNAPSELLRSGSQPRSDNTSPPAARRETRLMGSQGLSETLDAIAQGRDRSEGRRPSEPDTAETMPPPSPIEKDIARAAAGSPVQVNAVSAQREGKMDGFSSAISIPAMKPVRPSGFPGKKPSNPTLKLSTPVPAPLRSSPPPSAAGKPLRTVVAPGVTIVRPDSAQWQPHPTVQGATLKLLFRDPRAGIYTALLRLAPGAVLPRRRHAASEEVLVVSGVATVGAHELRAGEYCRAESESVHEPITTSSGCTLFVCGSENDEFLEEP
jgi:quercetin dioxygenase-like cupin family protein